MSSLIVIPVRGTQPSKTRLAPLFSSDERIQLVQSMLTHMLGQMPTDVDVAVITRSPDFLRSIGSEVAVLEQLPQYPGLNGSLAQAILFARERGYRELLMLPGDLPTLQTHEIETLLLEEGRMVIVGDRDQEGTNGLRLPTSWAESFNFGMGEHSFAHHIAEAHRHGAVPVTVYHRGLAHDLDTPDDWFALPDEARKHLTQRLQLAAKGA